MIDNPNQNSFELDSDSSNKNSPVKNKKNNWYFISNSLELSFIISNGLIIENYGSNNTKPQAGWINLSTENSITSTEDIIIKIDTSSFTGQVMSPNNVGELKEKQFPNEFTGNEQEMYLRGPLPITSITEITFQSKESKENFIDRAATRKNEKIDTFSLKVKKPPKKQTVKTTSTNPPQIESTYNLLNHIKIAAAIRGLLFKFANKDINASYTYNKLYSLTEQSNHSNVLNFNDIFKELPSWQKHGEISAETKEDISNNKKNIKLFWKIFNSIKNLEREDTFHDAVINELDSELKIVQDDKQKQKLTTLIEDLAGTRNFSKKTPDELFKDHENPFSRALIIFFIRDKALELVQFRHNQVNMIDLLVASLLFGVREDWVSFSTELKGSSLFINEQSNFMARLFHERAETGIEIKPPTSYIAPLYDLLLGDTAIKSSATKYRDTRVMVAGSMKWDCIETTITLGKDGVYPMKVTGSGVEFTFDGLPKSIKTDVKQMEFSQLLADENIESSIEEKIRENLK